MVSSALIVSHDARGVVDSHGATLTRHDRDLWVTDRAANRIVVVDTRRARVVNEIALADRVSADPAPDLIGISPDGKRVYLSLRGPNPLTANVPGVNNAVGSTPGIWDRARHERGQVGPVACRGPDQPPGRRQ